MCFDCNNQEGNIYKSEGDSGLDTWIKRINGRQAAAFPSATRAQRKVVLVRQGSTGHC
jgi:hypothetical protein